MPSVLTAHNATRMVGGEDEMAPAATNPTDGLGQLRPSAVSSNSSTLSAHSDKSFFSTVETIKEAEGRSEATQTLNGSTACDTAMNEFRIICELHTLADCICKDDVKEAALQSLLGTYLTHQKSTLETEKYTTSIPSRRVIAELCDEIKRIFPQLDDDENIKSYHEILGQRQTYLIANYAYILECGPFEFPFTNQPSPALVPDPVLLWDTVARFVERIRRDPSLRYRSDLWPLESNGADPLWWQDWTSNGVVLQKLFQQLLQNHSNTLGLQNLNDLLAESWTIQTCIDGISYFLGLNSNGFPIVSKEEHVLKFSETWTGEDNSLIVSSLNQRKCRILVGTHHAGHPKGRSWPLYFHDMMGELFGFYEYNKRPTMIRDVDGGASVTVKWTFVKRASALRKVRGLLEATEAKTLLPKAITPSRLNVQRPTPTSDRIQKTRHLKLRTGPFSEDLQLMNLGEFLRIFSFKSEVLNAMALPSMIGFFVDDAEKTYQALFQNLPETLVVIGVPALKVDFTRSTVNATITPSGRIAIDRAEIICDLSIYQPNELAASILGTEFVLTEVKVSLDLTKSDDLTVRCTTEGRASLKGNKQNVHLSAVILGSKAGELDMTLTGQLDLHDVLSRLPQNVSADLFRLPFSELVGPRDDTRTEKPTISQQLTQFHDATFSFLRRLHTDHAYDLRKVDLHAIDEEWKNSLPVWFPQVHTTANVQITVINPLDESAKSFDANVEFVVVHPHQTSVLLSATQTAGSIGFDYSLQIPSIPSGTNLAETLHILGHPNSPALLVESLPFLEDSNLSLQPESAYATLAQTEGCWSISEWNVKLRSRHLTIISHGSMVIKDALVSLNGCKTTFVCTAVGRLSLDNVVRPCVVTATLPQTNSLGELNFDSPEGICFSDVVKALGLPNYGEIPIIGKHPKAVLRHGNFVLSLNRSNPLETNLVFARFQVGLKTVNIEALRLTEPATTFLYQRGGSHGLDDEKDQCTLMLSAISSHGLSLALDWRSSSGRLQGTLQPLELLNSVQVLHSLRRLDMRSNDVPFLAEPYLVKGELRFLISPELSIDTLTLDCETETLHVELFSKSTNELSLVLFKRNDYLDLLHLLISLLSGDIVQKSAPHIVGLSPNFRNAHVLLDTSAATCVRYLTVELSEGKNISINKMNFISPRLVYQKSAQRPSRHNPPDIVVLPTMRSNISNNSVVESVRSAFSSTEKTQFHDSISEHHWSELHDSYECHRSKEDTDGDSLTLSGVIEGSETDLEISLNCSQELGEKGVSINLRPISTDTISVAGLVTTLSMGDVQLYKPSSYNMPMYYLLIEKANGTASLSRKNVGVSHALTLTSLEANAQTGGSLRILDKPSVMLEDIAFRLTYSNGITIGIMTGYLTICSQRIILSYTESEDGFEEFHGRSCLKLCANLRLTDLIQATCCDTAIFDIREDSICHTDLQFSSIDISIRPGQSMRLHAFAIGCWTTQEFGIPLHLHDLSTFINISMNKGEPEVRHEIVVSGRLQLLNLTTTSEDPAKIVFEDTGATVLTATVYPDASDHFNFLAFVQDLDLDLGSLWPQSIPIWDTAALTAPGLSVCGNFTESSLTLSGEIAGFGSIFLLSKPSNCSSSRSWIISFQTSQIEEVCPNLVRQTASLFEILKFTGHFINEPMTVSEIRRELKMADNLPENNDEMRRSILDVITPLPGTMHLEPGLWYFASAAIAKPDDVTDSPLMTSATASADTKITLFGHVQILDEEHSFGVDIRNLRFGGGSLRCNGQGTYYPDQDRLAAQATFGLYEVGPQPLQAYGELEIKDGEVSFKNMKTLPAEVELAYLFPDMRGITLSDPKLSGAVTLFNSHNFLYYDLEGELDFGKGPSKAGRTGVVRFVQDVPRAFFIRYPPSIDVSMKQIIAHFITSSEEASSYWPEHFDDVQLSNAVSYYVTSGPAFVLDGVVCTPGPHMKADLDIIGGAFRVVLDVSKTSPGVILEGQAEAPIEFGYATLGGASDGLFDEDYRGATVSIKTTHDAPVQYQIRSDLELFNQGGFELVLNNHQGVFFGSAAYNGSLLGISNPRFSIGITDMGEFAFADWEVCRSADCTILSESIRLASLVDEQCDHGELNGLSLDMMKMQFHFILSCSTTMEDQQNLESLPLSMEISFTVFDDSNYCETFELDTFTIPFTPPFEIEKLSSLLSEFILANQERIGLAILKETEKLSALISTTSVAHLGQETVTRLLSRGVNPENVMQHALYMTTVMSNGIKGTLEAANYAASTVIKATAGKHKCASTTDVLREFDTASLLLEEAKASMVALLGASGLGNKIIPTLAGADYDGARGKYLQMESAVKVEFERAQQSLTKAHDLIEETLCITSSPSLDFGPNGLEGCRITVDWSRCGTKADDFVIHNDELAWELCMGVSDSFEAANTVETFTSDKIYISKPMHEYSYATTGYAWIRARLVHGIHTFTASDWTQVTNSHIPRLLPPTDVKIELDSQTRRSVSIIISNSPRATYQIELVGSSDAEGDVTIHQEQMSCGNEIFNMPIIDIPEYPESVELLYASVKSISGDATRFEDSFVVVSEQTLRVANSPLRFTASVTKNSLSLSISMPRKLCPGDFDYYLWQDGDRHGLPLQHFRIENIQAYEESTVCYRLQATISPANKDDLLLVEVLQKASPSEGTVYRSIKELPAMVDISDTTDSSMVETNFSEQASSDRPPDEMPQTHRRRRSSDRAQMHAGTRLEPIMEETIEESVFEGSFLDDDSFEDCVEVFTAKPGVVIQNRRKEWQIRPEERISKRLPQTEILKDSLLIPEQQLLVLNMRMAKLHQPDDNESSLFQPSLASLSFDSALEETDGEILRSPESLEVLIPIEVTSFALRRSDGRVLPRDACVRSSIADDISRIHLLLDKPFPKSIQAAAVSEIGNEQGEWSAPWLLPSIGCSRMSFKPWALLFLQGALRIEWDKEWSASGIWKEMMVSVFDEAEGTEIASWVLGAQQNGVTLYGCEIWHSQTAEYKLKTTQLLIRVYPTGDRLRGGIQLTSFTLPDPRIWRYLFTSTRRPIAENSNVDLIPSQNGSLQLLYTGARGHVNYATHPPKWQISRIQSSGSALIDGSNTTSYTSFHLTEVFWIGSGGSLHGRFSQTNNSPHRQSEEKLKKWKISSICMFSNKAPASTHSGGSITATISEDESTCHLFWVGKEGSIEGSYKLRGGNWTMPYRIAPPRTVDTTSMSDLVALSPSKNRVYVAWIGAESGVHIAHCTNFSSGRPAINITRIATLHNTLASKRSGLHITTTKSRTATKGAVLFWVSQHQAVCCAWSFTADNTWTMGEISCPGSAHRDTGICSVVTTPDDVVREHNRHSTVVSTTTRQQQPPSPTKANKLKRRSGPFVHQRVNSCNNPSPTSQEPDTSLLHIWYFTPLGALRCSTAKLRTSPVFNIPYAQASLSDVNVEVSETQEQPAWSSWSSVHHQPKDGSLGLPRANGRRCLVARTIGDGRDVEVWYVGREGKIVGYRSCRDERGR